ncbi:DUF58 domain-containing protein [Prosthecomicrobium sp. N25]|uniref:DUF58 domain-containing protein n=1 Tax=Prosthecomicrobium sp. N25 TaxID=3129254 RepID=UPI003077D260
MADSGSLGLVKSAKSLSSALPDLLVEARRVAATVASGWHGRRQAGPGETFWQFRPFAAGESVARIDWRRSARDDHLYVREREWESAHTVWLWPDLSPSMDFHSRLAPVSKRDRAVVLMLAVADLLARGGERVGVPGLVRPTANRAAAERTATALALMQGREPFPDTHPIRRFSDLVLVGDFLDPIERTGEVLSRIAGSGARGHLVQVMDPTEETFPFVGRTEFRDPETGERITAGRAETWVQAYRDRLAAHREALRQMTGRFGWTFLVHHTDRSAAEPLLALHGRLSAGARGAMNVKAGGTVSTMEVAG